MNRTEPLQMIRPSGLELAVGFMLGSDDVDLHWDTRFPGPPSPRLALEAAIGPALRRPPCLVSFSGGRDSSLVLAVATHVARREGLPLPIPRSRRFAGDQDSEESSWQELVVRHLRLEDWDVVDCGEDLDVVGPQARPFLLEHGVVFAAPLFVLAGAIGSASGGSHLTGEGGDEIMGLRKAAYARQITARPRTMLRRLGKDPDRWRELVTALGPEPVRRSLLTRSMTDTLPGRHWLRPQARQEIAEAVARGFAADSSDWRDSVRWLAVQRAQRVYSHNVGVVAAKADTLALDPLMDWGFMQAMARSGGRFGFASRAAAMEYVAGDLLPREVITRETKATFNTAYFSTPAREFVEGWDGTGLDESIVDPEALRDEWSKPVPAANSFMLLQTAWLASQGQRASAEISSGARSRAAGDPE